MTVCNVASGCEHHCISGFCLKSTFCKAFIYKDIQRSSFLKENKIDIVCRLLVQRESLGVQEAIHASYCESGDELTGTEETLVCCHSFFFFPSSLFLSTSPTF